MATDKFKKGDKVRHNRWEGIYTVIGKNSRGYDVRRDGASAWYVEEFKEEDMSLVK